MNKSDLLKKYGIDRKISELSSLLQTAKSNELVFYYIRKGQEELFKKRYELSQKPIVLTNKDLGEDEYILAKKEFIEVFYPKPKNLKLCGITGTNGKTTTVFLAMQMAQQYGKKALSLGTYGLRDEKGLLEENPLTTPSEIEFRKICAHYDHYDALFFEFSSHALEQERIGDIQLDVAAWTNFSQDHLDFHKTEENYFLSKKKILKYLGNNKLFIPFNEHALSERIDSPCLELTKDVEVSKVGEQLRAEFNRANLSLAIAVNRELWKSQEINLDYSKLTIPDGRFEILEKEGQRVVIDFAHTPDALEKIILSLKEVFPNNTLSLLFGCGGNRDKAKRAIMGEIAEKYINGKIYITSDNPRDEDPQSIIDDIKKGLVKDNFIANINRAEMIRSALNNLEKSEVLLIAGKGSEDYQEIKGVKHPFSDKKTVQKIWGLN